MLDIQKFIWAPKIVTSKIDDQTTLFEVNYFPRGVGHTIGNALRRIILAYTYGWAITALKIKGVPHEYSMVDGLKESIIDIMLNFKKLRFKVDENIDTTHWISQRFSGVGTYTSDSLKLPSGIDLLNSEYLFEISDRSTDLIIDIRIEKGYGYYGIDFLRRREANAEETDANILLIDNDFKLVEYVKYEVEEVIDDFVGSVKDSLKIEIKAAFDAVDPKQLLSYAWEILASYAKLFIFDDIYVDKSMLVSYYDLNDSKEKLPEEMNIKTMPIDALPLSERTRNALIKNNILYVEELEKKKKWELLLMKGVGRKAIDEINVALWNLWKSLI